MLIELDEKGYNIYARSNFSDEDVHDKVNDAYFGKLGPAFQRKTEKRVDWVVSKVNKGLVLDVGCSQGIIPILASEKKSIRKVIGIDVDSKTISEANEYLGQIDRGDKSKIEFAVEDYLKYKPDTEVDCIVLTEVLEHLVEPSVFINKAHEDLKEGGRIIITVPFGINNHPDHRQNFYVHEIVSLLSERFEIMGVELMEKWAGFVAKKSASGTEVDYSKLLDSAESKFYEIERSLTEDINNKKEKLVSLYDDKRRLVSKVEKKDVKVDELESKLKKVYMERNKALGSYGYRVENKIKRLAWGLYSKPILGAPLRMLRTMVSPKSKKIINGWDTTYSQLVQKKRSVNFNLGDKAAIRDKKIKVAAVCDEFTYNSFRFECELLNLSFDSWKDEIDDSRPDLLLIESAWRGKDGKWRGVVVKNQKPIRELIEYCKTKRIPTIFWNKEDPAHTGSFMPVANACDLVFTSDANCLPIYRRLLKHPNVHILPFAAQPRINNPIEKYEREDKFSFAGSYYAKYKRRTRDFLEIVQAVSSDYDLDIYDRNFNRDLGKKYKFPDELQKHVKGSLPYSEIDKAYKGYEYAININTVKDSPTMFARRAFELLASNTITVSNYSKGVKNILGDTIISSDSREEIVTALKSITETEIHKYAYKLTGLRNVLENHTYERRLLAILKTVFSNVSSADSAEPDKVVVVAEVDDNETFKTVMSQFDSQTYQNKQLLIICEEKEQKELPDRADISFSNDKLSVKDLLEQSVQWVAFFDPNNLYGKNYLKDLIHATLYCDAGAIGHTSYLQLGNGDVRLVNKDKQYKDKQNISIFSSIVSTRLLEKAGASSLIDFASGNKSLVGFSTDGFNFVPAADRADVSDEETRIINGELDIDTGATIEVIRGRHENPMLVKEDVLIAKMLDLFRLNRTYKLKEYCEEQKEG